ncbi:stemmadenine O-acetyltransferase-like [Andrographis paniculata]|uniref:stemmadenine O-acetyltransferase-like n=1 Tax=Andrographis paniculata TaxID=175694 RepID=UPI0021E7BCF2|nr:stemmadenine O-acetyltransferase-like [Andrographis paniculata]
MSKHVLTFAEYSHSINGKRNNASQNPSEPITHHDSFFFLVLLNTSTVFMNMESKVISSEYIEPSSPTPSHLRTYNLSMLDQVMEPVFIPIVLFFPPCSDNIVNDHADAFLQVTQQLKHSLSSILTRFYPLAGRANQYKHSIDCNDAGVHFIVARFSGHRLSDLLKKPDKDLSDQLFPRKVTWDSEMDPECKILQIKVSYFDCGSVAIGAIFWHKVGDAATMVNFLKAWGSTNRGSKEGVCPNYISQYLFPHKEELLEKHRPAQRILNEGKWTTKRYIFDSIAISSLKAKTGLENPTRVEAVSAFLWNCFMAASLKNGKSTSAVAIAANLRGRAHPPFPSDCFGNFISITTASSMNRTTGEYKDLARKFRDTIKKVDGEYVSRLQGDGGLLGLDAKMHSLFAEVPDGADLLTMSSWCRFGGYDIDFGWGKPLWMTAFFHGGSDSERSRYMNLVSLMDTRNGNGIEALVTLGETHMPFFDAIEELHNLACIEPSPLHNMHSL